MTSSEPVITVHYIVPSSPTYENACSEWLSYREGKIRPKQHFLSQMTKWEEHIRFQALKEIFAWYWTTSWLDFHELKRCGVASLVWTTSHKKSKKKTDCKNLYFVDEEEQWLLIATASSDSYLWLLPVTPASNCCQWLLLVTTPALRADVHSCRLSRGRRME